MPCDLPEALSKAAAGITSAAGALQAAVIDTEALARAISAAPPPPEQQSFEWRAHINYAKREYLRALIQHYHGDLKKIAQHWDRSSENTLRKLIREFCLEEDLREARQNTP